MLNEKIKHLRNQNNLTQEELAEKLNVSRQAVTKWESGAGTPDIDNVTAIARFFGVSLDELLSDGSLSARENISRSEFDVFEKGEFELSFGSVSRLEVTTGDSEKVVVELGSDLPDPAYRLAKVRLENGKRIDLAVVQIQLDKKYLCVETNKTFSRQDAKSHLFVKAVFPKDLAGRIELNGDAQTLSFRDISEPCRVEFDGKASEVHISRVRGHLELTSGADMEIYADGSTDQLDINQLGGVSTLYLKKGAEVELSNKGRSCELIFDGFESVDGAEKKIELNGRKTEMTVRGV